MQDALDRRRSWTPGFAPGTAWLTGGAALCLAVYAVGLGFEPAHKWLGGVLYLVAPATALAVTVRAAGRTAGRQRFGWLSMAAMLAVWLAAEATYSYYTLVLGREAPFPSVADALYYAGYVAFVVGVIALAYSGRGLHDWRSWLDALIVVTVACTLSARFLIVPVATEEQASTLAALAAVGYPAFDLGILVALLVVFYGARGGYPRDVALIAAAAGVLVATDALYSLAFANDVPTASALDLGWLLAYWLIAAAALQAGVRRPAEIPGEGETWLAVFLPYAALAPLVVTILVEGVAGRLTVELRLPVFLALLLSLARQGLTLLDNRALLRQSEASARRLAVSLAKITRMHDEARFLSRHDELTGLLNRRAWFAAAATSTPSALLLIDIDHFKTINDSLGHLTGDEALHNLGQRLREVLGPAAIVGRLGGEEFGALLLEAEGDALERSERLVEAGRTQPLSLDGKLRLVQLSAGFAAWHGAGEDAVAENFRRADRALYAAKRQGRGRLAVAEMGEAKAA